MRRPEQSKDIDFTQHNWPIVTPHLQIAFSTSFFRLLELDNFSVVVLRVDLAIKVKVSLCRNKQKPCGFQLDKSSVSLSLHLLQLGGEVAGAGGKIHQRLLTWQLALVLRGVGIEQAEALPSRPRLGLVL